ncbi:phage regulatory CII family protein [Sphingomonas sp. 28-62-20]|uniref:phage regulatory CII family protein n=1 Tax=Sphingomonas sp. 28-62-20 TaxID=1970433 RepID=UPI00267ADCC2
MPRAAASAKADCGFALLAYQLIIVEKKVPLADLALKIGMSYSALHSRLNRRTRFHPDEIRRLIACLPDQRLVQYFTADSPFVVAARADPLKDDVASIRTAVARAMRETIDVMSVVVTSLESGLTLDHRDRATILKEVHEAESAMASVHLALARPAAVMPIE